MNRSFGYWMRMAKFFLYISANIRSFRKAKESGDKDKFYKLFQKSQDLYVSAVFDSAKIDFEVIGQNKINPQDTYLVVANHSSILDIVAVHKAFPKNLCFVSKIELSNVIVFSEWMRIMGSIFIDRNDSRSSILEFNKAINTLKSGMSMCIFPEGTRSNTGQIGEFKKGSFKIALKSSVKILPLVLHGTRSVYENNGNKLGDGAMKAIFLDPIDVKDLTSEEVRNIHIIVRDKMDAVYKTIV